MKARTPWGPTSPDDTTPVPIDDSPPAAGGVANAASSVVALAIGVAGIGLSLALGVGELSEPGPGLWPLGVSVAIAALAIAQLVVGRWGGDGETFSHASWMAAAGAVTLVAYVALLPVIGFEIPSALLAFVWMRFLGHERSLVAILGSLAIVAGFYVVFVVALGTSIPHLF
ncbi:MAG TPA: tripartite tricarboxylate transporter TctB family protein [Microbacterium sp.]|nr:tripartite tricarboxylate transporter TctB family protein [Microbacterium sp.]